MKNKTHQVSLASESDRYQTIFKSLDLIFSDITERVYCLNPQKDYILIKPNCIVTNKDKVTTHIDALKAVLDFFEPIWQGRIIIAEGSGIGSTLEAFKNFGYLKLRNIYRHLEFLDLNYSDAIFVDAYQKNLSPKQIRISNTVSQAPLRISVGPPKTHDSVIVTLSIKNMAVGSILKEDKPKIHQGPKAINKTLANLNQYTWPHLAIIDGWTSMEGNGPINGKILETRFAAASIDCLAADIFVTERMGFNPIQIGYLNLLGAAKIINQIKSVGQKPQKFNFHFKHPNNYLEQIQWQ